MKALTKGTSGNFGCRNSGESRNRLRVLGRVFLPEFPISIDTQPGRTMWYPTLEET